MGGKNTRIKRRCVKETREEDQQTIEPKDCRINGQLIQEIVGSRDRGTMVLKGQLTVQELVTVGTKRLLDHGKIFKIQ